MKTSLSFAAILFCGATALAEDARSFDLKCAEGDKWVVSSTRSLDFDLTVTDLENKKTGKQVKAVVQEKYEREVQKLDGGHAAKVHLRWIEHRDASGQGDALEGKDATLDSTGGNLDVKATGVADEVKSALRIEEDFEAILPGKPVAVGATWSLDHREIARFVLDTAAIVPGKDGSGICTFESVEKTGDREVAKVTISLSLSGATQPPGSPVPGSPVPGWTMTAPLTGTLLYDLTHGRPVSLEFHGLVTVKGDELDTKKQPIATVEGRGLLSYVTSYEPSR